MGKLLPFKKDVECYPSPKDMANDGVALPLDITDSFIANYLPHAKNVIVIYEDIRDAQYYILHNGMSQERCVMMLTRLQHEAVSGTFLPLRED